MNRLLVFGAALALAALMIAPAAAKDSHAPPDARDRWLPCEGWVMYHRLPFSERRLYTATGIDREEFRRYIRDDDHHTLGKLIRRHGKDPDAIAEQLVSKWRGKVGDAQFAELSRRTGELMTQGHLAQHVFFHYFHHPAMALNSRWIFGVRSADYHRARLQGWSPTEIGAHAGRSRAQVARRTMIVLRRYARRSVSLKESSRGQARSFLALQRRAIRSWLQQDIHQHRQGQFPHGNPELKGTRLQRACVYLAGRSHPGGEHDDH